MLGDLFVEKGDLARAEAAYAEYAKFYSGGGGSARTQIGLARLALAKKDFTGAKARLEPVANAALKNSVNLPRADAAAAGQAFLLLGQIAENFMASAGLQVSEKELGVNLPSGRAATDKDEPITPILVQIGSDGQVLINSQSFDTPESAELPATREQRKLLMSYGAKDPVIIQPAPDVRQERVMQVLDAASAAGVRNLSFG